MQGSRSPRATTAAVRPNSGVGFAVPINTVLDLLDELRGGKVTRGVIGVQVDDVASIVRPDRYRLERQLPGGIRTR